MNPNVFVVRAEYGQYTESFEKNNYVGIGWFSDDPKSMDVSDKERLKEEYRNKFPDHKAMTLNQNVGQIYRFVNEINVGDIVVCPYRDEHLLVGKVNSSLYFEEDDSSPYPWRKKVVWEKNKLSRHTLSVPLQNTLRSSLTCFKVSTPSEIYDHLGLNYEKKVQKKKLGIGDYYDLVKERFLELDATEFELLVAYTLRTLGFDPTQETGKVGDGGIDFEGVLDVFGVAAINLQVQVKRYTSSAIGEPDIRGFRGALKNGYQGCFITLSRFSKKATESATDKERVPIQLIDGRRFTEIFIEQYDKIIDFMYADDADDLAEKLKFKKALLPLTSL